MELKTYLWGTPRAVVIAAVEGDGKVIGVARGKHAASTCHAAARALRRAAERFEELANHPEPFQAAAHDEVNK